MGAFKIEILGVGGHGCERKAKAGDKLYGRCGRFNCPDCMAYEFVQQMKQKGMVRDGDVAYSVEIVGAEPDDVTIVRDSDGKSYRQIPHKAEFTHWAGQSNAVVDDMLTNQRKSGGF